MVAFRYGPDKARRMLRCRSCKVRFSERKGTPLFLFINHWTSRGNDESQRLKAASRLRGRVDLILAGRADANLVIVGDLNDESSNTLIKTTLKAV